VQVEVLQVQDLRLVVLEGLPHLALAVVEQDAGNHQRRPLTTAVLVGLRVTFRVGQEAQPVEQLTDHLE